MNSSNVGIKASMLYCPFTETVGAPSQLSYHPRRAHPRNNRNHPSCATLPTWRRIIQMTDRLADLRGHTGHTSTPLHPRTDSDVTVTSRPLQPIVYAARTTFLIPDRGPGVLRNRLPRSFRLAAAYM